MEKKICWLVYPPAGLDIRQVQYVVLYEWAPGELPEPGEGSSRLSLYNNITHQLLQPKQIPGSTATGVLETLYEPDTIVFVKVHSYINKWYRYRINRYLLCGNQSSTALILLLIRYRKNPNLGHIPILGQKLPKFLEPSTKR